MPKLKEQHELSPNIVKLQPHRWLPKYQDILDKDISNWSMGDIADSVGLTVARVSLIRNSPIYKEHMQQALEKKSNCVIERKVEEAKNGDPVMQLFTEARVDVAKGKLDIALNGKSEFARSSAQNDILDRLGYKAESKKVVTKFEIDSKTASRWDKTRERALKHKHGESTGKLTIEITE